jgi:hypothetical protein
MLRQSVERTGQVVERAREIGGDVSESAQGFVGRVQKQLER